MGDTKISWTDKTWNPTRGCRRVSPGCEHCYAERQAARFCGPGQPYDGLVKLTTNGPHWTGAARFVPEMLAKPMSWRKPAQIFVDSMSDLFHEDVTNEQIAAAFGVMAACPQHTFQVLTKRAKRMREWFAWVDKTAVLEGNAGAWCIQHVDDEHPGILGDRVFIGVPWPLPNVWIGVSVENQAAADERIPHLLATPAAVRFLSCEPLLGPISLKCYSCGRPLLGHDTSGVPYCTRRWPSWVIAGCESGPGARPCDVEWLRSLRDQCAAAGVAFFLKQARGGMADEAPEYEDDWERDHRLHGVTFGPGSKCKSGDLIELPYLDGVQHAAMPGGERQ